MSLAASLDRLRLLPLEVRARAVDPLRLPAFAGSTLRGAFGHALKDAACVVDHRDCAACHLADACVHPALFEPRPPEGARRLDGRGRAPAPYVIRPGPEREVPAGEAFRFGVTLIGRAVEQAPVVAAALLRVAARGLTAERHRFRIERIDGPDGGAIVSGDPPAFARRPPVAPSSFLGPPAASDRLRVAFPSGVRILTRGALARELPFPVVARALLRRASTLLELHEGFDLRLDHRAWIDRAEGVRIERSDLRRADSLRWSARQERAMNLRGVRGSVDYAGDLAPFLPLLAFGVAVGVGKGTTFGLGRMDVLETPGDA
ncbi:MAG: CRISPR system precrRNA processing endoribonuclease RAMP protein Cas6 [Planctomycetota bacterium JB042]